MKKTIAAALSGVVMGYLARAHWPEFEWLVQVLTA